VLTALPGYLFREPVDLATAVSGFLTFSVLPNTPGFIVFAIIFILSGHFNPGIEQTRINYQDDSKTIPVYFLRLAFSNIHSEKYIFCAAWTSRFISTS
jgi:hypothetical protein